MATSSRWLVDKEAIHGNKLQMASGQGSHCLIERPTIIHHILYIYISPGVGPSQLQLFLIIIIEVRRIVGMKRINKRRMEELREEVGVREGLVRNLGRRLV